LKTRGMRIKGDDTPISPGEFRDVDIPSGAMRDNILPLPYKEPSQVLVGLMDKIVEDGRRFAAVADLKISDTSAQSPVGTTLAVLERMLKVMSAVQARIYYTMKQEFRLLAEIIKDNTPDEYSYEPEVGSRMAKKSDYDQIYDLPVLHRQMIETLGVKNAAKIVPMQDDMTPVDPVTENMNVMRGKPVKAFLYQDHEAHLAVHMAAMRDPKLAAIMGQNPQAQAIMAAAQAHIMEHVAFQYRKEIEKQLGAALPPEPDKDGEHTLPPQVEVQLSQLAAQAAAKLLQKDQAEAQMQQAQQQMQDPLVQMQQKELQIKEAEVQRKAMKDKLDAAARADEIRIKEAEMNAKQQLEGVRLGIEVAKAKDTAQRDDEREGVRMGIDIAKSKAQMQSGKVKTKE
jgi:hypothetical protein